MPEMLSAREAVKDSELRAKSRKYVVRRYGHDRLKTLGTDPIGRDYGLVLDVLLLDAVILNHKTLKLSTPLDVIRLVYKDGIKRPKEVGPRPWTMDDHAAGVLIEKLVEKRLAFGVIINEDGTSVRLGKVEGGHTFTVGPKEGLSRRLCIELSRHLLTEAGREIPPKKNPKEAPNGHAKKSKKHRHTAPA